MSVVNLALAAQAFGDRGTIENHMQGLELMVNLRGGFGSLQSMTHELPAKICRVDLGYALQFGHPPSSFVTQYRGTATSMARSYPGLQMVIHQTSCRPLFSLWTDDLLMCGKTCNASPASATLPASQATGSLIQHLVKSRYR